MNQVKEVFMRRISVFFIVLLIAAAPSMAQDIDLSEIDPADIDYSKVDLSDVEFYFNGPIEIFIGGLEYGGKRYVAKLDYDGGRTVKVEAPVVKKTGMRPQAIDLSDVMLAPGEKGVVLRNVIIEGKRFSGEVIPAKGNTLKLASYSVEGKARGAEERLAEYRQKISEKERELRVRDNKITRLENRIDSRRSEKDVMGQTFSRTLTDGFKSARNTLGDWSRSGGNLEQDDNSQRFAKYLVSQSQSADVLKYSFSTRARNNGWRGAGLHFLVSGSDKASGYGLGKSYLCWVTRDERAMQTDKTYIQLYKSMDDVKMIEVKSTITDFDIAKGIDVDIYVDKAKDAITVAANGEEMFTFTDNDFYSYGNAIAFRSLGRARFEDFSLKVK